MLVGMLSSPLGVAEKDFTSKLVGTVTTLIWLSVSTSGWLIVASRVGRLRGYSEP